MLRGDELILMEILQNKISEMAKTAMLNTESQISKKGKTGDRIKVAMRGWWDQGTTREWERRGDSWLPKKKRQHISWERK